MLTTNCRAQAPRNLAEQASDAAIGSFLALPTQPAHVPQPTPASRAMRSQPHVWAFVPFFERRVIGGRS